MSGRGKKKIAVFVCAILLMAMFVSSAFVLREAVHGHECTGGDCPVCLLIARVNQVRRGFGIALSTLLLLGCALAVLRRGCAPVTADVPAAYTPVGRKTRLNN